MCQPGPQPIALGDRFAHNPFAAVRAHGGVIDWFVGDRDGLASVYSPDGDRFIVTINRALGDESTPLARETVARILGHHLCAHDRVTCRVSVPREVVHCPHFAEDIGWALLFLGGERAAAPLSVQLALPRELVWWKAAGD